MSNIRISLAEVTEAANRIRTLNQSMYEELIAMKKEMDQTGGSWISDAGNEIRSRFEMFAARFDQERSAIDSYAKFLDLTVSSYDTLETTITGNASGIQY
jgi:uncharacterized protein YukE